MKSMSTKEEHRAFVLTRRFIQAVDYAQQIHTGWRKGTHVPYMAHLLGVASLVMGESGHVPFAVTEDMVIAALLHDAVEDEGGLPRLQDIEAKFGKDVAKIVKGAAPIGPKLTATRNRNGEGGAEIWKRFKRGRDQQLWYFDELIKVYEERCRNWRIVEELKRMVAELRRVSAGEAS